MYHFIALMWDPADASAAAGAAELSTRLSRLSLPWKCVLNSAGIVTYAYPPRGRSLELYNLPDGRGVVLGRLFPNPVTSWQHGWEPAITPRAADMMIETSGRHLIEQYWGSYIAFLRDGNGSRAAMVRDCSGWLPCYRTRHGSVFIGFADVADLASLHLPPFTINKRYLAGFISSSQVQIRECGLNEVTELLAGECFELSRGRITQFPLWDPRRVCEDEVIGDYGTARAALRNTAQQCIDAWASVHDSIVHRLSGGIDSSIVLGCLVRSDHRPAVVCLNEFGDDRADNERRYANLAASQAGVMLVEAPREIRKPLTDHTVFGAQRVPKPAVSALGRALEYDPVNELAARVGADAVWTGQGGDHLFYQMRVAFSAADFITQRGFRPGLLSAVSDAARHSNQPYLSVLQSAIGLGLSRAKWTPPAFLERKVCFLNRDALPINAYEYVSHPWASDSELLPKGKQYQVVLLAELLNRSRPMPDLEFAYEHHPLQSQPLMEVCLRIPTYTLLKGGRQRALARDAFRDCMPEQIAKREDKGETSGFLTELVRRNEAFIREALFDGLLARERIVDRAELEPYLVKRQPLRSEHFFPLLACIACEVWGRNLTANSLSAAA